MIHLPPSFTHSSFAGRMGIARVDITPPAGIYFRNWGAAKHDVADSVHRPLTLSVLTLSPRDRKRTLVFVDADLGWWRPLDRFHAFQTRLLECLSMKSPDFIFGLTHTHSAPPLMEAEESLPGSQLLNSWFASIYQTTIDAIHDACANQFDGSLDWHVGCCQLATVRDLPDPRSPADRFICGYNPLETADDTLLLGRVSDTEGKLRATVVNYACHPTTLAWENTAISPDYIGAMRETIETATGGVALFMQGASGELSPRHQYVGNPAIADQHGRQVGFSALATLQDMLPPATELAYERTVESGAPLAVWRHRERTASPMLQSRQSTVNLPLKAWPTAAELDQQRKNCSDRALQERLRRKQDIRRTLGDGNTFALPIWVWRIGDAVIAGSCCEAYSALQRELRQRFPNNAILCMNLANGSLGYLPPADKYDTDVYQVWQTPFARGSLEILIDKMSKVIGQLLASENT
jgi:hypothetical protein